MRANQTKTPKITLTLFVDDSDDSKQAIEALKSIKETFTIYDVQSLNMTKGDEIKAPTLYAPEGIFRGWRQIQTFVGIPADMRYKVLGTSP